MTSLTAVPMDAAPPRTLRVSAWAVVLLFAALQLAEIGRYRTVGGDETFYMEAAWTMLTSGDWLIPRYVTGELRFEKPIATYWAVAACTWVLGFSVWAARLHSVILSLATLPYVFGLARVVTRDRTRAWLAVLVYASLKSVHANAHQGRTDAILSFFTAAAMLHFARALFEGQRPRRDVVLGHAFAAGALLTKGLAGVLFTYVPLAAFVLLARRRIAPGRARSLLSPAGLATLVLVAAPWFVYVLATHAEEFVGAFARDQVTANVGAERTFLVVSLANYAYLFLRETFPWWPLLLLGLLLDRGALRRVVRGAGMQWLLLGLWLGLAILVLSVGNSNRGRYLLPTFPGLAVFVAAVIAESGEHGWMHRGLRWMVHLLTLASLLLALAFLAMLVGPLWPHDMPWVGWPVLALVLASLALSLGARRLDLWQSAAAVAALGLALLSCANSVSEQPAPLVPVADLGREVIAREPPATRVAVLGQRAKEAATVLLFTTGRRPTDLTHARKPAEQAEFVRAFMNDPGRKLIVLDERAYRALPADLLERTQVLSERSALLEHGLRPATAPFWVDLAGERFAQLDTARALLVVDPPR